MQTIQNMHTTALDVHCQSMAELLCGTFSGCACGSMLLTLNVFSMILSTCFCVARAVLVSFDADHHGHI